MPAFLPPEFVVFELRDDAPVIRLRVDVPAALDVSGWSMTNRATLCVIDGPGDSGYLIPRLGIETPAGWDDAVARAAGSTVVFGFEPATQSRFIAAS